MVTLEQLIETQKWYGMSDIQIIKEFFTQNNLEEEGMDLIHELTKTKIEKMKQKQRISEEWICILPSKYLYENYDLDIADRLHNLELNFLVNGGELSKNQLSWAKENIPNIIRPRAYFNPLIEWLENKDIRFKDIDTNIGIEKLFENENGYIYPFENGYKVFWKKEEFKPDIDITFYNYNEACFYLRLVDK